MLYTDIGRDGMRSGPNLLATAELCRRISPCPVIASGGVARLEESFPHLQIITASLDRDLNDHKYILPGLGDFGDRLFGTL